METNVDVQESLDRKARSMKILQEKGIYVMEGLPRIEAEAECNFQTTEAIARRGVVLLILALYSESMLNPEVMDEPEEAREYVTPLLERFEISEEDFSSRELEYFLSNTPSERDTINYSWQYENAGQILWALGYLEELPFPNEIIDVPLVVERIVQFSSMEEFLENSQPKSHREILDMADLIYRIDWVCVEARINGRVSPENLENGVVMERHKTLNWMIRNGEDWDEIDIST